MTTFSQLVDAIVRETRRPDLVRDIADYLNQTIRELHFTPERNAAIFYRDNLRELQLVADSESGFIWETPNVQLFQHMQAVKYDSVLDRDGLPVYPRERTPSRRLRDETYFYYRSGSAFAFAGYGGLNAVISLAFYEYPRRLVYYDGVSTIRAAEYDEESMDFVYDAAFNTPELQLDARNLTSNWLLLRHRDVLAEGLRAKIYKRLSDDNRARTAYSLYTQLRQGVFTGEISPEGGVN